jgi:hypothetical protein
MMEWLDLVLIRSGIGFLSYLIFAVLSNVNFNLSFFKLDVLIEYLPPIIKTSYPLYTVHANFIKWKWFSYLKTSFMSSVS